MKNWLVQVIVLLVLSTVAALVVNATRASGIALIGNWPSRVAAGGEPIVPPSAEDGDPPFITLDDAVAKYQSADVVFIDARDPEDYAYGHIRRAINIPFDYLDDYWEGVIASLERTGDYVVYCSGSECETSLHLGRFLCDLEFENVTVFYGGWHEWQNNGLPTAVGEAPVEGGGQ